MQGHRVVVRIKPDGSTEVSVDGIVGGSCADVTRAVEKALGSKTSDKRTAEFFAAQQAQGRATLNNGGAK